MTERTKRCTCLFASSIGKKVLVASTGVVLIGFIIGHLLGNLQVFQGQDKINTYAHFLQGIGPGLYVIRGFLLLIVGVHIWAAIRLALENKAARPIPYAVKNYREATYSSRTMVWSGAIIASFIVYHILHFTMGKVHAQYYDFTDSKGRHDVYTMIVLSFRNPLVAGAYIVSMFLLSSHLSHGFSSLFQTFGLNNPRLRPVLGAVGIALAWLIFAGYISIPLASLAGILKLPSEVVCHEFRL